jgi:Uma2 family endonuclease
MSVLRYPSTPLTADRLMAERPDDGRRHELIDGTELVTPMPTPRHQVVVTRVLGILHDALPEGLSVLVAPVDWRVDDMTVLVPDLVVVEDADLEGAFLTRPPRLVVEVASPATVMADRTIKRAAYEAAGVPAYWLVDPDVPSVVVLERDGQHLLERLSLAGDDRVELAVPFPLTLSPAWLV